MYFTDWAGFETPLLYRKNISGGHKISWMKVSVATTFYPYMYALIADSMTDHLAFAELLFGSY